MPKNYVEFDRVKCTKETDSALLCVIDGNEVWIPKSQLSPDSGVTEEGDIGTLSVTEWIAMEKELI